MFNGRDGDSSYTSKQLTYHFDRINHLWFRQNTEQSVKKVHVSSESLSQTLNEQLSGYSSTIVSAGDGTPSSHIY